MSSAAYTGHIAVVAATEKAKVTVKMRFTAILLIFKLYPPFDCQMDILVFYTSASSEKSDRAWTYLCYIFVTL
jgi:hypothetical protein